MLFFFIRRANPIFAANLIEGMVPKSLKYLSTVILSLSLTLVCHTLNAQENHAGETEAQGEKSEKLNPGKILMEHVSDMHEFHIMDIGDKPISIPLPVILYSPGRGFSAFMSTAFHHGTESHDGYALEEGKVIAVNAQGQKDESVKVYDISITRNVAQMIIALILLVVLMTNIAKKYKQNGAMKAPTGFQNAMEPIIIFIRDEVGKSYLGHSYEKYMPYLLTVFFFILINAAVALIPGSANVVGNIAFTFVLGMIAFVVIMFNTNKHFWSHIINPPAPAFVKPILFIVEFIGIFTKPFALIIRLFANMVAGHMIITCLILIIFIFGAMSGVAGYGFSPISLAFTIFIYFIEILVVFIQAFIFTNLTALFISQAFEGGHDTIDDHSIPNDAILV